MAFRVSIVIGENCDRCKKEMTEENPGVLLYEKTQGYQRNQIWLHLKCVEWNVLNKGLRLVRERKELLARTEPQVEAAKS